MALPKIEHKIYEQYLTGIKKTIKFRAFTVKEQKILLLAKEESKNQNDAQGLSKEVQNAVSQVLNNCIQSNIDPDDLCTFDMEELFLRLRSKSVGEVFSVRYRENYNDEAGAPQTHFIDIMINLDDVKVETNPEHTNIIKISDKISLIMRYPTFKMLGECNDADSLAMACIETIVDGDEMYTPNVDSTPEQLKEFYDSFESSTSLEIKRFFDTMPKLRHVVEVELHDKTKKSLEFEGLESFFG